MKILPLYRAVRCGAEVAQCDTRNGPRRSMRADGNNTEWTMCLEFNAGGSLPSKLVNGFVYGQSKLFAHMSKYFAKGFGTMRYPCAEERLGQEAHHPQQVSFQWNNPDFLF